MTDILMPALSPTMTEGKLARWLKKPGDKIAPGDVIAEIETDKAMMEVEAVDEGTLGEIHVPEGAEGVAVNAVIATLIDAGAGPVTAAASPPPSLPPQAGGARREGGRVANKTLALDGGEPVPDVIRGLGGADAAPVAKANGHAPQRFIASPLARRLAKAAGIDLATLKGSGPGGRIIKADVEKAPTQSVVTAKPAAPAPASAPKGIDARQLADMLGMPYALRPNSSFRKTVARRLTEAKQTIPHFYLTLDCRLDALLDLRKRYNAASETAAQSGQAKASVNDFVIRAAALALRKIPDANVSWSDDGILAYQDVDISVAVATPGGLITPVIRKADQKGLRQIAAEMRDLAARARDGKLKPQDYQGGTFSISNLGMFGIREFAAVINPPQSCILAVGAGEPRPVVTGGQLAVATVMSCTLSVDHRAVDGALGAEYLSAFKGLIEDPYSLLI
jgi:pyruvate dehydrogenase E2 component (dihydrolipoamide acetyltransferase)